MFFKIIYIIHSIWFLQYVRLPKGKFLMTFSILNRSDEFTILSSKERWHAYTVDILVAKLLKNKEVKDLNTHSKNINVINLEKKNFR